ncbi:MAG: glycosyltransferase family 2 protein, partial [Burkholderiales bacterium]
GIVEARSRGATHVLLLDQDSMASPTMVKALASALDKLNEGASRIAAVGPRYVDRATGHASSFVRFGPIESKNVAGGSAAGEIVRADFLISSGSLISIATLDVVGPMEDALFVDHIDTEWCLRAAQKGYQSFGVCDATMEHELGDGGRRVWLGRWRRVAYHSPLRHYYIFRNSALLHRRPYAPRRWRRNDRVRLFLIAIYFGMFGPERRAQATMMVRGWRDGRAGRAGSYPTHSSHAEKT